MPLSAGARLGRYEIRSLLGAGGMGEVYRAQDLQLGRDVALKVLPAEFAKDPALRQRFAQEARAVAALSHGNIIALHDIGVADEVAYMVTELVEGESLREHMRHGAVPLRKLLNVVIEIAEGLSAAHTAGIVHRDLKPENVMLTRDGHAKILDFGLAKPTSMSGGYADKTLALVDTEPGMVMGTLSYMSPEQIRADKNLDGRSDQFSLGLILYEMASGKKAFGRENPADTMSAILKDDVEPLPADVPEALRWVIERCLSKDPQERYGTTRDLYLELRNLRDRMSGSSLAALPEKAAAHPVSEPKKKPQPILLSVLVLLFLMILMGSAYWSGRYSFAPAPAEQPVYHRMTFRRGTVHSARFTPDGNTIVYSAAWDGSAPRLFMKRTDSPDVGLTETPGVIFSISSTGETLVSPNWRARAASIGWGNLSRSPLLGGSPREILDDVTSADWAPGGQEIAVARRVGNRTRLEFPIGKSLYETAGFLSHVRVSPGGDRIAFLDHPLYGDDRGFVAVSDRSGSTSRLTREWSSVAGLAWSSATGSKTEEIWFTAAAQGSERDLYAVNPARQVRIIYRIPGSAMVHDISSTGRVLLSNGSIREEAAIFSPSGGAQRDLTWLGQSSPADLSSDGGKLLFTEAAEAEGSSYSTWLRNTDGSPPVRLGDGAAFALSRDGQWALTVLLASPRRLQLLPAGAGEPRLLSPEGIVSYQNAAWMPDGSAIVFNGIEDGKQQRIYTQSVDSGKPRPVSAEGIRMAGSGLVSPDGKSVIVTKGDRGGDHLEIMALEGGSTQLIVGLEPTDFPVAWSSTANTIFVAQPSLPTPIYKLNVITGRRELWGKITLSDPSGVSALYSVRMARNEKTCAYEVVRLQSSMYLVDGLK